MVLRINIQILFLVFHEVLQIFNHRFFSFLVVQGIHPQPPLSGPTNKKITFLCESNLILKIFSASSHISMVSEAEVFQRLLRGRNLSHPLVVSQPSKPMQHNQSNLDPDLFVLLDLDPDLFVLLDLDPDLHVLLDLNSDLLVP